MSRIASIILAILVVIVLANQGCTDSEKPTDSHARIRKVAPVDDSMLARTTSGSIVSSGKIEAVALFYGPMPTGIAVSKTGRIFVNYPRWGDPVDFTVAEVVNGKEVPFPSAQINNFQEGNQSDHLVAVQSVVIDPMDRLWILDTATINMGPVLPGGAKLVCVDLKQNKVVKQINFPADVVVNTTYLNDVRFDLKRGTEGMAYITDSGDKSPNGIIVVDLASGASWRKLANHKSVKADENFVPTVEGQPLMTREPGKPEEPIKMASDGIAIDPGKGLLYYCPLGSHRIYSVNLDALSEKSMPDTEAIATIKDLPARDFASDGLLCDAQGNVFLTDYEHNAIRRLGADGKYAIVAADSRMIWPDSMSIGADGYLYFTANQLNRQGRYHDGHDQRKKPYVVFRTPLSARTSGMR